MLGSDDCLLIGGLAVGAHGYVRATEDVDFVTRLPLADAQRRFREAGFPATITMGDGSQGEFRCVKTAIDGVRVDVLPQLVPLHWDRGIEIVLPRNARLRVVDLDGLLQLKLRAGGPKDLMDAAALLLLHPTLLPKGRELALAYHAGPRLETWLADRRLSAEVEASQSAERARHRAAKPTRAAPRRRPASRH
jgi:hypothetical protein